MIGENGANAILSIVDTNLSLQTLQLFGNPFMSSSSGTASLKKAVLTRSPFLSCDVFLGMKLNPEPEDPMPIPDPLDAVEKKYLAIPLRTRYAKCIPDQMAFFECR